MFLKYAYIGSVLLSAGKIAYKNHKANKSIKNSGYTINDKRSFKEKFVSFIEDYSYMLLPGINLLVAYSNCAKEDSTYRDERMKKLISRGVLTKTDEKPKEETVVEEIVKEETPVVEKKPEKKSEKAEVKEVKHDIIDEKISLITDESISKIESMDTTSKIQLLNLYNTAYRNKHKELTSTNGSVQIRNELVKRVTIIENLLDSLYRQLEIEKLKKEKELITGPSITK